MLTIHNVINLIKREIFKRIMCFLNLKFKKKIKFLKF